MLLATIKFLQELRLRLLYKTKSQMLSVRSGEVFYIGQKVSSAKMNSFFQLYHHSWFDNKRRGFEMFQKYFLSPVYLI